MVKLQRVVILGYVAKLEVSILDESHSQTLDLELPLNEFYKLNIKAEDKLLINPRKIKFFKFS